MSGVYFTVLRKFDNSSEMNKLISFTSMRAGSESETAPQGDKELSPVSSPVSTCLQNNASEPVWFGGAAVFMG
jgi:hypothetical protein